MADDRYDNDEWDDEPVVKRSSAKNNDRYDNDEWDDEPVVKRSSAKNDDSDYDAGTVITMNENGTTKKVKIDFEIDTTTKDLGPNPFVKWIHLAKTVDSWRIFPRIFITVYIILLYKVVVWFMTLNEPNMEQSGLVSIVVGAGAAWFGLYVGSSKSNSK